MAERETRRARCLRFVLWSTLAGAGIAWALLLWHPWIDWFGRPR